MLKPVSISTSKPVHPALDYNELRTLGIQQIQKLASEKWTDYNLHDPGLTILEYLAYAITDLAFRTTFPVEDILATEKNTAESIQKHFFTANEILPNKSLTIQDYRKLLIDQEGVRNAWLIQKTKKVFADTVEKKLMLKDSGKAGVKQVEVKGFYDVLIEYEHFVEEKDKSAIIRQVREVLHENRNLCEEFENIGSVERQEFILCSEIEIEADTDPYDFLAGIFFRIQMHLTPPLMFHTLEEMFEAGLQSEEIFNGPLLHHGFIKDEDLSRSELKEEIYLSDIISEIMNVKGVKAVQDILFNPLGITNELPDKWHVAVDKGKQPVVNIEMSNVLLYKNRIPFRPDRKEIRRRFNELMKEDLSNKYAVKSENIRFRTGKFRDLSDYLSVQNHFPKTYGISEHGLPESASTQRKAQALQLKGFLLLFDQLLANQFSQLANTRLLFSLEDEDDEGNPVKIKKTYFSQIVKSFKDYEKIYEQADAEGALQSILERVEEPSKGKPAETNFFDRRNRFLDHLLARFSENFREYVWMLYSLQPGYSLKEVLETKISFLKDYPRLSAGRAAAFNYNNKAEIWNTYNISGLERRISKLLGIKNYKRRNLSDIHYEIYEQQDTNDIEEFRFRIFDRESNKILISSSTRYFTKQAAINEMKVAIQYGMDRSGYEIKIASNGRYYFNLINPANNMVVARRIEFFRSMEEAEEAVDYVIEFLHQQYSDEGMFLIEHLLLFSDTQPHYLPICVDSNCTTCEELDPYSFRISIVLPAYTKRFLNMDFRNYVERVIREETPAHIFPKICWIDQVQMQEFERKYRAWLNVKSGSKKDARGQALKEFIAIFNSLKTVYPVQKLDDCSGEREKSLFLLNQNAIGSLK